MGLFPPVLWMMLRRPNETMLASIVLWLAARQFGWNLPAYPAGTWYSTRIAGRCCSYSAPGARSAGRDGRCRSSMRPTRSISASPISSLR